MDRILSFLLVKINENFPYEDKALIRFFFFGLIMSSFSWNKSLQTTIHNMKININKTLFD